MQELVTKGFRLSPQQRRLWLWHETACATPRDARAAVLVEGPLDADALREAAREVVARHEALRTDFEPVAGMRFPVQAIADEAQVAWHAEDLDPCGYAERAARIAELFDETPSSGARVRCALLKLSASSHVLLVALPALCADAATVKNFVDEVARAYAALACEGHAGPDEGESEETVQYVQFSEWQNELLEDDESAEGREFWRAQNSGAEEDESLAEIRLPWEGEGADTVAGGERRVVVPLDDSLQRELEEYARRRDARPSDVLLAAWAALLARLAGRADLSLNLLFGCRVYEEMRAAFGPYAKWIPARLRVEDALAFDDLVARVGKRTQGAEEWQEYYSAEEFDAEEDSSRDGAPSPVAFEFAEWASVAEAGGVRFTPLKLAAASEPFKLRLRCANIGGALSAELHYDPRAYGREVAERVAGHYAALLASLLRDTRARVMDAELLTPSERERVLVEWNATAAEFPSQKCLHELFAEQARRTPERAAVVFGETSLTYAELNARANRLARELRRRGVTADSVVALCVESSAEMVVALIGVLKAGGCYVPLDAGQPAARLRAILSDARASAVVTQGHLAERLPADFPNVVIVEAGADADAPEGEDADDLPNVATPENLAYVIYTSGSTGTPKGVCIRHRAAVNLWAALARAVYRDEPTEALRVSVNAPLAFDSSFKQVVQLLSGHTLHVVPEEVRIDGEELLRFIRASKLDVLDCTPSQLRMLLDAGLRGERGARPSLLLVGGEAIDRELWESLAAFEGARSFNVYGPTECTVDATARLVTRDTTPRLGRPVANTRVYVLDENLRPVPVGVAGELCIGGCGLARGYLARPDLTAERFVPDPFSGERGARLYRTGDVARWLASGELEYIGRRDAQVKVRGHRIELGEIESALAAHSGVKECAVAVREDARGDARLVAYVVGAQGAAPSAAELRAHLSERLPEYMLPAAFVALKSLPLSRNGKVDRKALPAPDDARDGATRALPRTPTEEVLATVWAQVFGVERVGTDESFFELGGHSLLATRVVSRVRQVFQIELPVRALFEAPTVAGLAARVETILRSGRREARPPVERVARERALPASFAQQRLWFLYELEPQSTAYQLPVALRLKGRLDASVLERTFGEIVRRHEILRTTFATEGGRLVQVIAPARAFELPVIKLAALTEEEREREAHRLAAEESARPFDLTRDAVLRAKLVELAEDDRLLLLTMHHIASDEWSMNLLVREVLGIYAAFNDGRPSPLAELAIQYADFAAWQRRWLTDEALEADINYWRQQLGDGSRVTELPSDRPRPAVQTYSGAYLPLEIPEPLADALKTLSRGEGATLFMTLMAAFKALLRHHTRDESVVVGVPVAGRTQVETESLIGFFVNMLVMRTDAGGDPKFTELLARVRETTLGAYAHGDVPFEKLVEKLRPERDLARHPLFQIAFTFDATAPEAPAYPGLEVGAWGVEARTTRYELVMALRDTGRGVAGSFQYNTDLYNPARIARMAEHFKLLLGRVAEEPSVTLSELSRMLDDFDRRAQGEKRDRLREARTRMLRAARQTYAPAESRKGEAVQ